MAVAAWHVYVDWDGSGSFTDVARKDLNGEHVTAPVRKVKQLTISRGKSLDFQRYVAGQAEVLVSNPYGYFDPESPGIVESDGTVGGIRTTLANNQPVVDADRIFATPTAAGQAYAQSFSNAATRMVDRVDVRLKRTGSPGGNITLQIYTSSATLPSVIKDNYATARVLAVSSISTSYQWAMFTFERPVILVAGTTYHVVLTTNGYTRAAGTAELAWGYNTTNYTGGAPSTWNGTAWSALTATEDFKFRVTANDVIPGRRCWIMATYSGTDYPRFYGRLKAVQPHAGADQQDAYLLFEDLFAEFAEKEITLAMATDRAVAHQSDGSALTDVLTDMGQDEAHWSIGSDGEHIPYAFYQRMTGQEALENLVEFACGFHFMQPAAAGVFYKYTFRSRHYEYTAAAVDTWDASEYQDASIEHRMEHEGVYNRAIVVANPRLERPLEDVWQYGNLPETWGSTEPRTIRAEFTEPCTSVTAPVSGTDYTAGWTVVATSYATHADLVVTPPAAETALTELKIRGTPLQAQGQMTVVKDHTESQSAYAAILGGDGVLLGPIVDNDLIQTYNAATRVANTLIDRNKRKFPDLTVTRSNRLGYPGVLSIEVGDLVNITSGALGVAGRTNIGAQGTYMIENLDDTVTEGGLYHFQKVRLRKAAVTSQRFFQLDIGPGLDVGALAP